MRNFEEYRLGMTWKDRSILTTFNRHGGCILLSAVQNVTCINPKLSYVVHRSPPHNL
jgi:hypothetical protein